MWPVRLENEATLRFCRIDKAEWEKERQHLRSYKLSASCRSFLAQLQLGPSALFRAAPKLSRPRVFATSVCAIKIGDPIAGYCEPTNGGPKSAQMASWGKTAVCKMADFFSAFYPFGLDTWQRIDPKKYPTSWEYNQDSLYVQPHLHIDCFIYLLLPRLNAACFYAP